MQKSEWQGAAGDTWAAQWRRTDRSFATLTETLLATLRGRSPRRVLDIGCGAGELSLAIARGHPMASVTGVDVSEALIAVARERADHLSNIAFQVDDAARWRPQPPENFDLLVSRHGVMFFDDPVSAFANFASIAAAGARLTFSCFRTPAENPFFTEVLALLPAAPPPIDPHAPGPFAFADNARVGDILAAGGWSNIAFTKVDFPMIAGVGEDAVEQAVEYFRLIGPAARATAEMDEGARARFLDRVRELAERNCRENVVSLPAAGWIVSAGKAG